METIKISGVKRNAFGKKESKLIRKEGLVPCTIYGRGETIHFFSRCTLTQTSDLHSAVILG